MDSIPAGHLVRGYTALSRAVKTWEGCGTVSETALDQQPPLSDLQAAWGDRWFFVHSRCVVGPSLRSCLACPKPCPHLAPPNLPTTSSFPRDFGRSTSLRLSVTRSTLALI